jgi:hypothetical protein
MWLFEHLLLLVVVIVLCAKIGEIATNSVDLPDAIADEQCGGFAA